MEVRIGVHDSARELTIEPSVGREAVLDLFRDASASKDGLLILTDEQGRSVAVLASKIAYLDFSGDSGRKVGFGA